MKKHALVLLLYLLLASCSNKWIFIGKYASNNSSYGLNIKRDSTFDYKFYQFHVYEYSTGRWHKKSHGDIILNSFHKDITIPLVVIESSELKNENVNKFFFEFRSNKIAAKDCECAIIINDTVKEIRRCDSIALVEIKIPVHKLFVEVRKSPLLMTSLRFSLEPLTTKVYSTYKDYGNFIKFNIMVNDSLFSYKVFDNKVIKVKKRGIYFYDEKGVKKHWIPKLNE